MRHLPRPLIALPAVLAVAVLAACGSGGSGGSGDGGTAAADPAASSSSAAFTPVTIDNCGTEVTIDTPPERVVAIKSTSIELLLALGLGDRMVGTAFSDGPVPDDQSAAYDAVPVLSDKVPGQEALLEVQPDSASAPTCRRRPARRRATCPTR
jgi:iron complex transport system substrate-binding protein